MSKLNWEYAGHAYWRAAGVDRAYAISVLDTGKFQAVEWLNNVGDKFSTHTEIQAAQQWCQAREDELTPKRPHGLPWKKDSLSYILSYDDQMVGYAGAEDVRDFIIEACNAYHGLLEDKKRLREALGQMIHGANSVNRGESFDALDQVTVEAQVVMKETA